MSTMTIPVMAVRAPAFTSNGAQASALLSGKSLVTRYAHKGSAFLARVAAKLHLGSALAFAQRTLGWVVGKLGFIVRVAKFLGIKDIVALTATTHTGQRIIAGVAKLAYKVIAWPLGKLFGALRWAARLMGMESVVTTPAAVVGGLFWGAAEFAQQSIMPYLSPDRLWMQLIASVAGFRINWTLSKLSFIPGWIGMVFRVLLVVGAAMQVFQLIAGKFFTPSLEKIEAEMDGIEHALYLAELDAKHAVKEAAAKGAAVQEIDAQLAHKADALLAQERLEKSRRDAASLGAEVVGISEVGEVVVSEEDQAHAFLLEHGSLVTAKAIMADELKAFPVVMSKNQAKKIIREAALEERAVAAEAKK